jgi:hypothetical protein
MKKIKVSIKDSKTLELQEDAKKGDIIDLGALSAADVGTVNEAMKIAARQEAELALAPTVAKEIEAATLRKEKELRDQFNKQMDEVKNDKVKSDTALEKKNLEIEQLKAGQEKAIELALEKLKNEHIVEKNELNKKIDEEVERVREYKSRKSSKRIGEDFEKFCEDEFNKFHRAFPNSTFKKDNDAKTTGTKGDYIFEALDADKNRLVSIMFDMKDERDETIKGKENKDHFQRLDKNRTDKKCDYAVLVSTLEPESDLYNEGIVLVPETKYKKMYVVRPEFFIPIISALYDGACGGAEKAKDAINKLAVIEKEETDVTNFMKNLDKWKADFANNARLYRGHIGKARQSIVDAIKDLEKVLKSFDDANRQLENATDKAENLSIKKLAKDSPGISKQIKADAVQVKK